jgi:uncharacterized membrane protein
MKRLLSSLVFTILFSVSILALGKIVDKYLTNVEYTVEQKIVIAALFAVLISLLYFGVVVILVVVWTWRKAYKAQSV